MQDLIIVCAGGFGRDVYQIIRAVNKEAVKTGKEEPYNVLGFIDDTDNPLKGTLLDLPILGTIKEWHPKGNERYVLGISTPKNKEKIADLLKSRGAVFETIISPNCEISVPESVRIGEGCIISANSIDQNTTIGNFVHAMGCCILGQDSTIGDYSTITAFVNVACKSVGKRVLIGSHAVLLQPARIGDDATVCACSLVVRNVKPGTKVFGVPAKKVDW